MKGFGYLLKEGFKNVYSNRIMSIASVCVLVSCLVMTGAAALFSLNVLKVVDEVEKNNQTTVFIKKDTDAEKAKAVAQALGDDFAYFPEARLGRLGANRPCDGIGTIAVATGGTSDIPVAEEAALVAEALGNRVVRLYDVGVAGLHRLLACTDELRAARVVIAVAGMEGALPSVIGGLVEAPVIAVPTSVGYGASFGGAVALLAMLNSCAAGISVVNIDNGFGAGFLASRINHLKGAE